ncbi:MAG: CotH kinase family protein [Acidobacteriota bacterium]
MLKIRSSFCLICAAPVFLFFCDMAKAQVAANAFFDDTKVQTIQITMNASDWTALQQNYLLNTYYPATMTWNGVSAGLGIRSHGGNGSRSPVKPNLDFNFAHYTKNQVFLGLPFILLKANNEDPSNLREWLSMKLYRRMGLPAPREALAQLFINGQILGLYSIVEHEDETFLQRDFGESSGYLYEWEYGLEYEFGNLGTDPSVYGQFLELKTDQTSSDLQTFANFIQAVNQSPADEAAYIRGLAPYMNPKLFLSYCATENVLADEDGVLDGESGLNNFYLYQFGGTTLYQMIAWDKDRTFSDPNRSIVDGITTGTNQNILAQRLYGFADYQAVYLSELNRAATLFGGSGGWADSEITREYNVIHQAAMNDPNKQCDYSGAGPTPCGISDFENSVTGLHTYIAQRSGVVLQAAAAAGYTPSMTNPQLVTAQVDAANAAALQLSPGALANLGGSNLGAAGAAAAVPLPRILGSTFVAVDGVRAPLLSTSPGQALIQMPGDLPAGLSDLVVSTDGAMSNTLSAQISPATPAILVITRADGSAVAAGNAPKPQEYIVLYALGLGAVTPDLALGNAVKDAVTMTVTAPELSLGNASLNVTFSGLVPGFVGLYQVNARMPAVLPQGASASLTLTDNGATTSALLALQ